MIQPGDVVGYDGIYCAEKNTKIGILPIGYNDGIDRRFLNTGVVINNILCPIIGRISMNLTTIDISHVIDAKIGDEVVIIDENYESPVSLVRQAEHAQTIPYDMLVHMNKEMYRMSK